MRMSFSTVDVFFSLIVLIFIIIGTFKGLVAELFGKLSFILGILAAIILNGFVCNLFLGKIHNIYAKRILAFLLVFILVFTLLKILQKLLSGLFGGEILGSLDRALGFFLGLVEGIIVVALVIYFMSVQTFADFSSVLEESFFYRMLSPLIKVSVDSIQRMPIMDSVSMQSGSAG